VGAIQLEVSPLAMTFSIKVAGHEADDDTAMTRRKGEITRSDLKGN
jgi:hypothetical protein